MSAYLPRRRTHLNTAARVIAAGGMPGWQITLIALAAVLVAATAVVFLDRDRASRQAASTSR